MISSLIDFGFLVANEISIHFSRIALNYTTDELLDYVLADNDSDLSGEISEKDSDKKISEDSSLNLDMEDDIHVNTDTVGSDHPWQKVRVRDCVVVRKVRTRGGSCAGMFPPKSNTRIILKNDEFEKTYTKEQNSQQTLASLNIKILDDADRIDFVGLFLTDELLELIVEQSYIYPEQSLLKKRIILASMLGPVTRTQ